MLITVPVQRCWKLKQLEVPTTFLIDVDEKWYKCFQIKHVRSSKVLEYKT